MPPSLIPGVTLKYAFILIFACFVRTPHFHRDNLCNDIAVREEARGKESSGEDVVSSRFSDAIGKEALDRSKIDAGSRGTGGRAKVRSCEGARVDVGFWSAQQKVGVAWWH